MFDGRTVPRPQFVIYLFCLTLRRALRRFGQQCALVLENCSIPFHLEYIDDMILKLKQTSIAAVMPILDASLWSIGLRLNRLKSKALFHQCLKEMSMLD